MRRTKFCYSMNAKSHYPSVQSDVPKMFPPLLVQLTKPQVQQMKDCRIKHGQSVPQKTVRDMTEKDNPGTVPVNLYLTDQPTSHPIDFCAIGQWTLEGPANAGEKETVPMYSKGSIIHLASDASSGRTKLYTLQEDVTSATQKAMEDIML